MTSMRWATSFHLIIQIIIAWNFHQTWIPDISFNKSWRLMTAVTLDCMGCKHFTVYKVFFIYTWLFKNKYFNLSNQRFLSRKFVFRALQKICDGGCCEINWLTCSNAPPYMFERVLTHIAHCCFSYGKKSFELQGRWNDFFLYEMKSWAETGYYICLCRSTVKTFEPFRTFEHFNLKVSVSKFWIHLKLSFSISGNKILSKFCRRLMWN